MDLTRLPLWARTTATLAGGLVVAGVAVMHWPTGLIAGGLVGFVLTITNVEVDTDA